MPSKKQKPNPAASLAHMVEYGRGVRAIALQRRAPGFVLGLDLGRGNVGSAILTAHGGALYRAKTRVRPLRKSASQGERIERLLNVAKDIVADINAFKITLVAIEDYAQAARFGAHQYGEVGGVVKTQLWLSSRVVADVYPPKLVRKMILGYGGNVPKERIFQAVKEIGIDVATDHEADAWLVAMAHFLDVTGGVKHGRKDKAKKRKEGSIKKKRKEAQGNLF